MNEEMNYIDVIATDIWLIAGGKTPEPDPPMLYRMYAVLALTKGLATTLADVHDAWAATYADLDKDHRSLVPFEALSYETQELDRPYMEAIHQVARLLPPRGAVVIRTEVV